MKSARAWVLIVGALSVATVMALADNKPNPYECIWKRNPFGLKDAPPPQETPAPPVPPAPPLPIVRLAGITTINGGPPRALLEITEPGGKGPAKTQSPILYAGERLDAVEVVSIDPLKNEVTLKIGDMETNLTFATVETARTASPGPKPAPGIPVPTLPTLRPAGFPTVPGRPAASAITPGASAPGSSGSGSVMVFGSGNASMPASPSAAKSSLSTFGAGGTTPRVGLPTLSSGGRLPPTPPTASGYRR